MTVITLHDPQFRVLGTVAIAADHMAVPVVKMRFQGGTSDHPPLFDDERFYARRGNTPCYDDVTDKMVFFLPHEVTGPDGTPLAPAPVMCPGGTAGRTTPFRGVLAGLDLAAEQKAIAEESKLLAGPALFDEGVKTLIAGVGIPPQTPPAAGPCGGEKV